jgi:hypothetical protein
MVGRDDDVNWLDGWLGNNKGASQQNRYKKNELLETHRCEFM